MSDIELTIRIVAFTAVALPAAGAIGAIVARILLWERIKKWRG
jgi:hypothetical protein